MVFMLTTAWGLATKTTNYPVKFDKENKAYICMVVPMMNRPLKLENMRPVVINHDYANYGRGDRHQLEKLYVFEDKKAYNACSTLNPQEYAWHREILTYLGAKYINGYKVIDIKRDYIKNFTKQVKHDNILLVYKGNRKIAQINTDTPLESYTIKNNKIYITQKYSNNYQVNHFCFYLNKKTNVTYGGNDNQISFTALKSCMHNKKIENEAMNGNLRISSNALMIGNAFWLQNYAF